MSTTYLADAQLLLRWVAADSEADILTAAKRALTIGVEWQDEVSDWVVDGPVIVFDSASPGPDIDLVNSLIIELEPGRYDARAAYLEDEANMMIMVQLTRLSGE